MTTQSTVGPAPPRSRCRDDHGSGFVAGIVILFAFTFTGLVWLARDVDRGVSNASTAQSIAFQAARSGAQAVAVDELRAGRLTIDPQLAHAAAVETADALFANYGVDGSVSRCSIDESGRRITVEVTIVDGGTTVTGVGIVTAERTE